MSKRLKSRSRKGRSAGTGKGKAGSPKILRKLRVPRDRMMHIHEVFQAEGLDAAERALAAFHPGLSPDSRLEVVHRISDPGKYGGIETGTDPETGDYADIAITKR